MDIVRKEEEIFLRNLIKDYKLALNEFNTNSDMLRPSVTRYKTPAISIAIKLKYFTVLAALKEACAMVHCDVARKYFECSELANKCPQLVFDNKSDEASLIMNNLHESKEALFKKYSK